MKKSNFAALILGTIGMVFFWNVHGTDRRMGNVSAGSYRRCDRTCNSSYHVDRMEKNGRKRANPFKWKNSRYNHFIYLWSTFIWNWNVFMHGIWKNGTWCCDRTCRHYRTVNVNSIDQRIKIKIIENIIYAKDTAYRMKVL